MYYVLGPTGDKYGPADVPTLRQWAAEGRLVPATRLEDVVTGRNLAAQDVPGLFDPPAQAPYSPVAPPAQQPYSPVNPPSQQPYNPVAGAGQAHPYNSNPKSGLPMQSPYVRYDSKQDVNRNNSMGQAALILIILTFVCCPVVDIWAYGVAIAAIICSAQAKSAGHEKGKLYLTLSIVGICMKVVTTIIILALNLGGYIPSF